MRNGLKWLAILAVAYVGLCMLGGAYVVDRALRRSLRYPVATADRARADTLARSLGARLDTVSIAASDGATLRGWLFTPARPSVHSVLLLHGITGTRAAELSLVPPFVDSGYRSLAVDLRAHGESDGEMSTFGALEADDLRRWIAWLRTGAQDCCVYEFGFSLGAFMALQASDAPGLCAVVAVAAEASLREVAFDRIAERAHAGPWVGRTVLRPAVELGFLFARLRYGVNLATASAFPVVAQQGAPILLIHGMDDDNVRPRHARMLQDANPRRVTTWMVPGATHETVSESVATDFARVTSFFAAHRREVIPPARSR